MNLYDTIKEIEKDPRFLRLINNGIIPLSVLSKKCYYEKYIEQRKDSKKGLAIFKTAEEYGVCEMTILRAVKLMEK